MEKTNPSLPKNKHVLHDEINEAIKALNGWGSIEIFVQNFEVTQITTRSIKKTKVNLSSS